MSSKRKDLKLDIKIGLVTHSGYNTESIVDSSRNVQLVLDSDAPKRKIIDAVENAVEEMLSEASRLIHHSHALTDGEVAREEQASENKT